MTFAPVSTLADLATLDEDEIVEGYRDARDALPDDPLPGGNRGRAYWHGWCNRLRDRGLLPPTDESAALCREYLTERRAAPERLHS